MSPNMLGIEKALEGAGGSFINRYRLMRDRLLNVEYEHWAAGFPAGNNHGRGHILRVLENLKIVLEACGSSLAQVVKTTVFVKDLGEFAKINETYAIYFPENPPARATVEAARLPRDVKVEIECVALVSE